jgi:hypothetical protein
MDNVKKHNICASLADCISIDVLAPFDRGSLIYVTGRAFKARQSY